jgi:hypothetical protein
MNGMYIDEKARARGPGFSINCHCNRDYWTQFLAEFEYSGW